MHAVASNMNRKGYGHVHLQQHCGHEAADLQGLCIDGVSALYQKGSQPENAVSTRLRLTMPDFETSYITYLPADLQLFSDLLGGHLAVAWNALIERDGDVAHLIEIALADKTSLLEQVFRAFQTLRSAGKQVPFFLLGLGTASWTGEWHIALSTIELIQIRVASVKKSLISMRASYVALLEHVQYLADCTAVELDYANQCAATGFSTTAGLGTSADIRNFEIALHSLREAEDVMGGCFNSWLYLHEIELSARALEKGTQRLRNDLLKARTHDAFPPGYEAFCAALEQLDEQFKQVLQC